MSRIPGTHVSLEPPAGFAPAAGFAGFSHPELEAAIAVTELPTPHGAMVATLSAERLAAQGATVVLAEQRGGAWFVRLHEEPWTGPVERWMAVLGDDRVTALVIATAPSGDEPLARALEAALATATFDPGAATSPFEGLRFAVTEAGGMRLAARSHGLVVLTEGGDVGKPQGAPMLTVGSYESPDLPTDWFAFASGHLKDLAQVTALAEPRGIPIQLPSGPLAYELQADGVSAADGKPLVAYVLAAGVEGLRVVVSGLVAYDGAPQWLPVFREIARSVVFR